MSNDLDSITYDWGCRSFTVEHMQNRPIRALRMAEEAVEAAQALGVDKSKLHLLIDTVYARPRGDIGQELGGMIVTSRMLCLACGIDPEAAYLTEIMRCLSKSPMEFAVRNQDKIDLGLDA